MQEEEMDQELITNAQAFDRRAWIVQKVRKWGGSCTDAVLDPHCKIFTTPNVDGLIGYRMEKGCAVVYGDPICPPSDIPFLTKQFHAYCQAEKRSIIYLAVSESFARWAVKHVCTTLIEFGQELYLDPEVDKPSKSSGSYACLVRRKVKHATNGGIKVHEYRETNPAIEKEIEEVGRAWIKSRKGPQIHISNVYLFANRVGKRWFYATLQGKIIGVLLLNQLEHLKGWHLNHLMVSQNAPGGTPEILLMTAVDTVAAEHARHLSFGPIIAAQLGEIEGLGKISSLLAHWAFNMANRIFNLQGRKGFWEKFQPRTAKTFLLFSKPRIGINELKGLMQALNVSLKPK